MSIQKIDGAALKVAAFRTGTEHKYRDTSVAAMAKVARNLNATMMPYAQYSEQAQLNSLFGCVLGKVKTTIAAAATAQTSVTAGTFASGGATTTWDFATPAATTMFFVGTPGSGTTQNVYTAPHAFLATAVVASPASFTIASQSIGLAVTAGDIIVNMGIGATQAPAWTINTMYIGLTTQATGGATQTNVLSGEPTIGTGSYARIVVPNNLLNWTAATAASPSVSVSAAAFSFPQSSAAWSTAGTALNQMFICDNSSGTTTGTVNVLAFGALGTPQAVNAGSITLSFASTAVTVTLT